jgi:hypothetical protein
VQKLSLTSGRPPAIFCVRFCTAIFSVVEPWILPSLVHACARLARCRDCSKFPLRPCFEGLWTIKLFVLGVWSVVLSGARSMMSVE